MPQELVMYQCTGVVESVMSQFETPKCKCVRVYPVVLRQFNLATYNDGVTHDNSSQIFDI